MRNLIFCFIALILCGSILPAGQKIKIVVDPRIELISIIQYLSASEKESLNSLYMNRLDFAYKHEIDSYFKKFKGHNSIKLFDEMSGLGYIADVPPSSALYISLLPKFKIENSFPDSDDNKQRLLRCFPRYREAVIILRKNTDLTEEEIATFQDHIDAWFR